MTRFRYFLCFILSLTILSVRAQTAYLPLHTEVYHLLDRMEAKSGALSPYFFSSKPVARKDAAEFLSGLSSQARRQQLLLSPIDAYNIDRALSINGEWVTTADGMDGAEVSKRPVLRYFYTTRPNLFHVNTDDFFLVVNPVIYAQGIWERNQDGLSYINTRGAELRGRITDRVGFYTMLADNQEAALNYVDAFASRYGAFPGNDYYRKPANSENYDLFMARGYVDVSVIPDHVNLTFGYDKHFKGDGVRSLFLSDFGAAATFLRIRSRWGRFSYENLFMELMADYARIGDRTLDHKYAAMHQLGYRARPWLEVGIFESTLFNRHGLRGTDFVPVLFYQTAARALGSDQKTSLGFFFKAIALGHLQVYGQAYMDQLKLSETGKGWWGNQYGLQLGAKYFDAFTLPNLDLQGELNLVRPFTYASNDSITNYTHYNQALAHPYGAGFVELIGKAYYQPIPRMGITATGILSIRGNDTSMPNYGNDIFAGYAGRHSDYHPLIPGDRMQGLYLNLNLSYEIRPNLYLEAGGAHLRRESELGGRLPSSTSLYGGIRWNIARKAYDFY